MSLFSPLTSLIVIMYLRFVSNFCNLFNISLPKAKSSIITLFLVILLISFAIGLSLFRLEKTKNFENAIQAVSSVRGFQGLVLDSIGTSSLLIGMLEKPGDLFVNEVELKRVNSQPLLQTFYSSSGKFVALPFSHISVKSILDGYEIRMVLLLSSYSYFLIFIYSVLIALILTGAILIYFEYRKRQEKLLIANKVHEMALQIAHDIKSPLAALDMVISDLSGLQEEKRILVRSSIIRIKDIANNLLQSNREATHKNKLNKKTASEKSDLFSSEPRSLQLISSMIESIVSEKRFQFQNKSNIKISSRFFPDSLGSFSSIQSIEFKRVISNLLNNAIEILDTEGHVEVQLESKGQNIELRVKDNGKGIPPEVLKKLGQRGETHGKAEGNGLGLYHARKSVESCSH